MAFSFGREIFTERCDVIVAEEDCARVASVRHEHATQKKQNHEGSAATQLPVIRPLLANHVVLRSKQKQKHVIWKI